MKFVRSSFDGAKPGCGAPLPLSPPRHDPQAVDPLPFLRTVKDLDGNAIDVSVQQDAQGFLLDLFDKMEVRYMSCCCCCWCWSRISYNRIVEIANPKNGNAMQR